MRRLDARTAVDSHCFSTWTKFRLQGRNVMGFDEPNVRQGC